MDDPPFCYLTTLGRRTGRPHEIEIWFVVAGATAYLMAGGRERADWVRNLVADPEAATLRVGAESFPARGPSVGRGLTLYGRFSPARLSLNSNFSTVPRRRERTAAPDS